MYYGRNEKYQLCKGSNTLKRLGTTALAEQNIVVVWYSLHFHSDSVFYNFGGF